MLLLFLNVDETLSIVNVLSTAAGILSGLGGGCDVFLSFLFLKKLKNTVIIFKVLKRQDGIEISNTAYEHRW